jgi:hypothetical protein
VFILLSSPQDTDASSICSAEEEGEYEEEVVEEE